MADTTALKNRIRAAIKANDNQEITGLVLQQALLDMVDELDLNPELENEAQQRQTADTQQQTNINQLDQFSHFSYNIFNLTLYLNSHGQTDYVASFTDAVALIPTNVRQRGLIFTFATDSSYREWETWQYNYDTLSDSSFYNILLWKRLLDDYGTGVLNLSLFKYKKGSNGYWSDINAALAYLVSDVPTSCRYRGMYLTFATNGSYNDWQLWQYNASSNNDSSVGDVNNWVCKDIIKDDVPTPGSANVVTSDGVTKYSQKAFLSNTGKFNSIFKELYIANANFDVAQVTSIYIDKAMYRSTGGVYRDQIVLKIGDSEVAQFKIDSNASDKALAIYRNREVNYGADINGAMIFFILDWSSLESNQRHTFDVTLTDAVTKIECNPTIYSILKTNKRKYLAEDAAWTAFAINIYGAYTDTGYIRSCSGNIYIPDNSKTVSMSGIASGYKYEVAVYNKSNELIKYYDGWKTDTQEFILPNSSYYIRILMARADNTVLLPYDLINGNPNLTIEFAANEIRYALHSLTIGNMNVRGFADTIESTQKSDNPVVYLPKWKEVMTWLNQDFLTIVEWWDKYDKDGNINAYDALLKQFYPYHYTINGQRGLFSKIPCSFETKTRNYNQIVAKTTINGKSLAVVAWVQSNTDDEAKVRADSQWMIDYLQDFDMVVVSGDFNNEQGPQFLQVWLDNGYTLGNCGYWGEIDTCITSAFTHSSNDNIVVKGFGSYDNFEKGEEKVGSDHYPVRAKLGYVI